MFLMDLFIESVRAGWPINRFFPSFLLDSMKWGVFFEILFEYKTLIALFDFSPLLKLYFRLFMYLLFRLLFYK